MHITEAKKPTTELLQRREKEGSMLYRVTIAEAKNYKQFVGEIEADEERQAREKAMQIFIREHWEHSAHCKVIMCSKVLYQ